MSGVDIEPNHPGLIARGIPGATRYVCPFCDWFHDDLPYAADHYLPTGFVWTRHRSMSENIQRMITEQMMLRYQLLERIIEDHLGSHVQEMTNGR